ncbi:centrosomal protein of 57 kDa [Elysia marginata]|uniref:Centrosomal protein of 57 kDa n=1 Tax=Elysia marginata TaxID=1093978 RepID=A0AAV4HYR0_9GAST|nr:centrosomal protein of 57 kDa [Elysia marginata]
MASTMDSNPGAAGLGESFASSTDMHGDFTSSQPQEHQKHHHRVGGDDGEEGGHNFNQNGNIHPHHLFQGTRPAMAETTASTKYLDYPTERPFLNSEYPKFTGTSTMMSNNSAKTRPERTVNTYPTSDRDELEGQLTSAENRCRQLELQLENMRTMVHTSERNRRELVERTARARQEKDATSQVKPGKGAADNVPVQMDRLNELERDQMRLTATQTLAETKIRELEEKVKEERVHRRLLQERTAHLESETKQGKKGSQAPPPASQPPAHAPRIPVTTQTPHVTKKSTGTSSATHITKSKKPPKKKMKKKAAPLPKRPHSSPTYREREQNRHYRLNLAEIPFVAGKSTSASHSLGANVQKVLAMMKSHNKALCSSHPWSHRPGSPSSSSSSSGGEATESSTGAQELSDLLNQLQEEFGYLCSQQQEVMSRLHEAHAKGDFRLQTDLESQLDTLVSRMEAKSGQISKIRLHQQKLENGKKQRPHSVKVGVKSKRPHSAGGRPTSSSSNASTNGHHHNNHGYSHNYYQNNNMVNGNMRPKPHNCNKPIGHSALGNPALFMLRDMKKLQSTLRKDDLSWE